MASRNDRNIDDLAASMTGMVSRASSILMNYDREVAVAIKRHFRGFRRNRSWLQSATRDAAEEICRQVAMVEGCYEEDINEAVCFLICRYPIAAVVSVFNDAPIEEFKTGSNFEGKCFEILVNAGFEVRRVGGSGDQGADLIANMNGLSYAVQCKDYGKGVGNSAVPERVNNNETAGLRD